MEVDSNKKNVSYRMLTVIGILVLVLILIAVGVFFLLRESKALTLMESLYGPGTQYLVQGNRFEPIEVPDVPAGEVLVDEVFSDDVGMRVRITQTDGDLYKISTVNTSGEVRVLEESPGAKAMVALQRNGTHLAFAERKDETGEFSPFISAWNIRTINLLTGEQKSIGDGVYPQFFLKDGQSFILFTTRTGFSAYNMETGNTATAQFLNPGLANHYGSVSPLGSYLLTLNPVNRGLDLFSIDSISDTTIHITFAQRIDTQESSTALPVSRVLEEEEGYAVVRNNEGKTSLITFSVPSFEITQKLELLPNTNFRIISQL